MGDYTAGLSKIRTSQITVRLTILQERDCGSQLLLKAVYLALDIYRSRIEYAEISQKPLR
jgi:4-hydroxythreonine-4-phosphate dehydrogenase